MKSEFDCISVNDKESGLKGLKDDALGRFANENGYTVVTADKASFLHDNFEAGQKLENGIVAVRLHQLSPETRAERVSSFLHQNEESLKNKSVILELATERVQTMEEAKQNWEVKQKLLEQKKEQAKIIQQKSDIERNR